MNYEMILKIKLHSSIILSKITVKTLDKLEQSTNQYTSVELP